MADKSQKTLLMWPVSKENIIFFEFISTSSVNLKENKVMVQWLLKKQHRRGDCGQQGQVELAAAA